RNHEASRERERPEGTTLRSLTLPARLPEKSMLNLATKARPYLGAVALTTALLTAGGIYSATLMPSGVYPEVTFPRIAVVARVPDWDVTKMELKVTRPLEEALSTVLGVNRVRSKTIRGGSELSIDFNPGTDMRRA